MTGRSALASLNLNIPGLPEGGTVGVAVSGGSDSLALLHLLDERTRYKLRAVTVNHGLRPEAASEALHVERICTKLGVPHTIVEWKGWNGRGNLQDQARRNRYSLIAGWAVQEGIGDVALGHTLDDLAETFLMRLARSSGVDGLAGMQSVFDRDGARFVRPLLSVGRTDLRSFLEARGIRWVEDPSNEDIGFDRIKAREALLALQAAEIPVVAIAGSAQHLRQASDALSAIASEWVGRQTRALNGDLVFDRTALASLPAELIHRVLSAAIRWIASTEYPPRRDAVLRLIDGVHRVTDASAVTLHGCRIAITDMTVRIAREHAAVADLAVATDQSWDTRWTVDGPHDPDLYIRALGEAVSACPEWRATKMPRPSLLASPAVWQGDKLIAAPVAGFSNGWVAKSPDLADFQARLITH